MDYVIQNKGIKKILHSPETTYYHELYESNIDEANIWRLKMCDKYIDDPYIKNIKHIHETIQKLNISYALNPLLFYYVNVKMPNKINVHNEKYNWITGLLKNGKWLV